MRTWNIIDFGAVGDGVSLCTTAIQRAIDLCGPWEAVVIPAGTFVSGALFLKSRMTLRLEKGARLLGSGRLEDYPLMTYGFEGYDQSCYASLLNTDSAPHEDITIEGEGVIDANGVALFKKEMAEKKGARGRAICLRNTDGVTIRGVTVRQSPAWCVHLLYCRHVLVEDVRVHTRYDEDGYPYEGIYNGDGIDIDACRDVTLRRCTVASQDDCVALKSGRDVWGRRAGIPTEQVLIEDCRFLSGFGVAVGSEMAGGVSNVLVRRCAFHGAFSLASVKAIRGRGAYIRDITFEDCEFSNLNRTIQPTKWFRGALYVDSFYGQEEFDPDRPIPVDETTPTVENLVFRNLTLRTVQGWAVYLCGLPERPVRGLLLENVRAEGPLGLYVKNITDLRWVNTEIIGWERVSADG